MLTTARSVVQPPSSPEDIPVFEEEWSTFLNPNVDKGECFPVPPAHPTVMLTLA